MKSAIAAFVIAAAMAFAAAPAAAQPASDAAKIALAKDILLATRAQESMTELVDSLLPSMLDFMKKNQPNLGDDVLARFKVVTRKNMIDAIPDLLNQDARIWADHFTQDELKQIDAFYTSKTGRDMVAKMPQINQVVVPMADSWGRAEGAEAMKAAVKQLQKEGMKI